MNEKPHKKLDVWNAAIDLFIVVHNITDTFPPSERYTLVDQARRASLSVPSNVAEGAARQTRKEFIKFLHIAQGSLSELDTQMEVANRLGLLKEKDRVDLDERILRIDKMLSGLIRHLRNKKE